MKSTLLIIASAILMCSCVKALPIETDGSSYIDNNYPKLDITLPFIIESVSKKTGYTDVSRYVIHKLTPESGNLTASISKFEMIGNYRGYSATDSSNTKKHPYYKKVESGDCIVKYMEYEGTHIAFGRAIKHNDSKTLTIIKLYEVIGNDDQDLQNYKFSENLMTFIESTDKLCTQLSESKNI